MMLMGPVPQPAVCAVFALSGWDGVMLQEGKLCLNHFYFFKNLGTHGLNFCPTIVIEQCNIALSVFFSELIDSVRKMPTIYSRSPP